LAEKHSEDMYQPKRVRRRMSWGMDNNEHVKALLGIMWTRHKAVGWLQSSKARPSDGHLLVESLLE